MSHTIGLILIFMCGAVSSVYAESTLIVGLAKVKAGDIVSVPVDFKNDGSVVGLQFDLFLPIDEIENIDVGECFKKNLAKISISACRQMSAPNHDVIRYLLVSSELSPIPSGHLTDLVIHTKPGAFSGRYFITVAPSTALGSNKGGDVFPLAIQNGQLRIVGGQHPSTRAEEFEPMLFADNTFTVGPNRDPSTTVSHKTVNDFELLAGNPERLSIRLPNGVLVAANRRGFKPTKGFVPRIGSDDLLPDPFMSASERSYFWRGSEDQTDVRFTVHNGYVRGTINAPSGAYTLIGAFGDVSVNLIDLDNLPPSDAEVYLEATQPQAAYAQTFVENASSYAAANVNINVLVMFTAQARIDAGFQVGLDALILESMTNLNEATLDSGIEGVTFTLAGTQQLFGFTPSGTALTDVIDDLRSIRLNPAVRAARDSNNADVVMVLLRNFRDPQGVDQLGACGVAFVQNKICSPNIDPIDTACSVGVTYEDYAYSWSSVSCANLPQRNSFPHEIGHILGGEHQPATGGTTQNQMAFPWSRGYGSASENISTLMYIPGNTPQQYIQFSNPSVLINGHESGVEGASEAASTVFSLAPIVAGFRGPASEVILRNSFETGTP